MVTHTCEMCNFSTPYKNVYRDHMNSIRHHEIQHRVANNMVTHTCDKCKRMFLSYSGLKKHKGKCKGGDDTVVNSTELIHRIEGIQRELHEIVDSYMNRIGNRDQEPPMVQEPPIKHTIIPMKPRA